jgi:asparagine synthetase B (glutamine-hydrolysing)
LSGDGLLMMSSGKDSVAIAVALAELGRHPRCVTFKAADDDNEHVFAAEICNRLGLEHKAVEMPSDPTSSAASLVRFFEASPSPTADHAAIAYAFTLATSGVTEGACLDGGGNDPYMGYVIAGDTRKKVRYRIRGRRVAAAVKRLVPVDSPVNYLARSAAASLLPGRNPRHRETRRFYADAVDTDSFWYRESRAFRGEGLAEGLAVSRLRHTEAGRSHLKTRLAARAFGLEPVLPFCDADVADYYFHLPEASRYDRAAGTNKVLLRELLADRIDYDPVRVGDGYFRFDGARFMATHIEFVRDEIRSCELWGPSVGEMTDAWLDAISQRPLLWHALFPVFMLSGWHNHSRFVPA